MSRAAHLIMNRNRAQSAFSSVSSDLSNASRMHFDSPPTAGTAYTLLVLLLSAYTCSYQVRRVVPLWGRSAGIAGSCRLLGSQHTDGSLRLNTS